MSAEALLNGALLGGLFALVGLGLSLVFGIMRLVNLAHGILVLAGAYLAIVVTEHVQIDPLLALVVVAPVLFVAAFLTQWFLLSRLLSRGVEAPLVATFGLLLLGQGLLTQFFGGQPRSLGASYSDTGFDLLGMRIRTVYVIGLAVAVVVIAAVHLVLTRTRFGAALRASAADPATASTLGINIRWMYAVTFAGAAVVAGIAGILYGTAFSVAPVDGLPLMVLGFTVVVLGGVGSVVGTLVGGVLVGLTQALAGATVGPTYALMTVYVLLLVVLVVRPNGLLVRRPA